MTDGVVFETASSPALAPAAVAAPKPAKADAAAEQVSSIQVTPWHPDTPYLKRLKAAGKEGRERAYAEERKTFGTSPAFYLDCAEWLLREGEREFGVRVLTNLAELRIEDAALLRVLAWRLQQAGELDRAVVLLRRVTGLRPEDPQSWRDLALALAERGKAVRSAGDVEEALRLLEKVVLQAWNRTAEIEIFALEELNALLAWSERAEWAGGRSPAAPALDARLRKNLDVDVRIVLAWDADATDVDLHVLEPTGEEAFYSHNRTTIGGLVSRDITDGYGPEEYLVRKAFKGAYAVKAKYYGSRQQTVVGPATLTATVFTDWGRPQEKRQTLTLRLDQPRDIVEIGRVTFGGADEPEVVARPVASADEIGVFDCLTVGMTQPAVETAAGQPAERLPAGAGGVWVYRVNGRTWRVTFDKATGKLTRVAESLPGGAELIAVQ